MSNTVSLSNYIQTSNPWIQYTPSTTAQPGWQGQQEFNEYVKQLMDKFGNTTTGNYGTIVIQNYKEPEPEVFPIECRDSDLEYYIHKHD